MGRYAKTMILLLLLVYLDPFIGKVKGLDHGASSSANSATNQGTIQVQSRKLIIKVDTRDYYSPGANPKHAPPPRLKSGAFPVEGGS